MEQPAKFLPTELLEARKRQKAAADGGLQESGMTVVGEESAVNETLLAKAKQNRKIGTDTTTDTYDRMPIENFGKNVLSKLGWKEDSTAKTTKVDDKILNLVPRPARLGLGAKPPESPEKKSGHTIEPKAQYMSKKEHMQVGSVVLILEGSHEGKKAKVLTYSKDPNAYLSLELLKSSSIVSVKRKRLRLCKEDDASEDYAERRDDDKKRDAKKKPLKWIREGLIVRVVSERVHDGRLYNKKVEILTILDPYTFTAALYDPKGEQDKQIIADLREKDIETVLPSSSDKDAQVILLRGEFKGQLGKVLEKSRSKEEATVQLSEECGLEIVRLPMDDVCLVK